MFSAIGSKNLGLGPMVKAQASAAAASSDDNCAPSHVPREDALERDHYGFELSDKWDGSLCW